MHIQGHLKNTYHEADWAIISQFIGLMLMISLGWCIGGSQIAGSLGLGGSICFIPNFFLYKSVFKYAGASQARQMLRALYVGELVKILLTMLLFVFVLSFISWICAPYVFIGYIVLQLIFWVAPVFWGIFKQNC